MCGRAYNDALRGAGAVPLLFMLLSEPACQWRCPSRSISRTLRSRLICLGLGRMSTLLNCKG